MHRWAGSVSQVGSHGGYVWSQAISGQWSRGTPSRWQRGNHQARGSPHHRCRPEGLPHWCCQSRGPRFHRHHHPGGSLCIASTAAVATTASRGGNSCTAASPGVLHTTAASPRIRSPLLLVLGYWDGSPTFLCQVELTPEACPKTAFSIGHGLWQFKVLLFTLLTLGLSGQGQRDWGFPSCPHSVTPSYRGPTGVFSATAAASPTLGGLCSKCLCFMPPFWVQCQHAWLIISSVCCVVH